MKINKSQIERFLEPKKLAIAGVSRNNKNFGHIIFKELRKKDFEVLPINPNANKIDGVKCFCSVEDIPEHIDSLLIVTPKSSTDIVLQEAINKGIKNIWIQQSSETKDSFKIAERHKKDIIFNKCIFMFAQPVGGIHNFHRGLAKFFGQLPK